MSSALNKHLIQPFKCFMLALKTQNSKKLLILKTVYQNCFSLKHQNKRFYYHGISFFKIKQSGPHMTSQNAPFNFILFFFLPDEKLLETFIFPRPQSSAPSTRPSFNFLEFMSPDTSQLRQRPKLQSYRWCPHQTAQLTAESSLC